MCEIESKMSKTVQLHGFYKPGPRFVGLCPWSNCPILNQGLILDPAEILDAIDKRMRAEAVCNSYEAN